MLSKEGYVGLVVCSLSLVLLGLSPGQTKRKPFLGTNYLLVMHACEGLREGDPVTLGGVEAGRVIDIDFAPKEDWERLNPKGDGRPAVLVTVALQQGYRIHQGAGYKVVSTLRGSHFVNILPAPPGQEAAPPGSVLNQELASERDDYLNATLRNFKTLSKQTEAMRDQFGDQGFQRDMKDLASNMRFYSTEFSALSKSSRTQLSSISRQLDLQEAAILQRVSQMDAQASRAAAYMHGFVPVVRQQLALYGGKIKAGQQQLDSAFNLAQGYTKTLQGYEQWVKDSPLTKIDVDKLSQQAHEWRNKLDDYANLAGDMHTISSDKQVQTDLKAIPRKYRDQSQKIKEQVQSYQRALEPYDWLIPEEHQR